MLIWPPNSPDFNIIEMIWSIIKFRVDQVQPKNIEELRAVIADVWENLQYSTINGLIDDFPRRCLLVLQNKGENIQKFISGGKLNPVSQDEIRNVIHELIADETILIKMDNIIAEKITEEEYQKIVQKNKKRRKTDRPIVRWSKEKDQIILLCYENYGKNYELIQKKFTEDVTIGALKNRLYHLLRNKKR